MSAIADAPRATRRAPTRCRLVLTSLSRWCRSVLAVRFGALAVARCTHEPHIWWLVAPGPTSIRTCTATAACGRCQCWRYARTVARQNPAWRMSSRSNVLWVCVFGGCCGFGARPLSLAEIHKRERWTQTHTHTRTGALGTRRTHDRTHSLPPVFGNIPTSLRKHR